MLRCFVLASLLSVAWAFVPLGPDYNLLQTFQASEEYEHGGVWPKPQSQTQTGVVYSVLPAEFQFSSVGEMDDVLKAAIERYRNLTFPEKVDKKAPGLKQIAGLKVSVKQPTQPLHLDTDESCTYTHFCWLQSANSNAYRAANRGGVEWSRGETRQPLGMLVQLYCRCLVHILDKTPKTPGLPTFFTF